MDQLLHTLSLVGFDWHIALANFVNFLIVFLVLYALVFKKLGVTLEARSKKIEEGLDAAAKGKHALFTAEKEKQTIIQDAEDKRMFILEAAEKEAATLAQEIVRQAKDEKEKALMEITTEKDKLVEKAEADFSKKAPSLVAALYEKTLKKHVTKEINDAFIASLSQ